MSPRALLAHLAVFAASSAFATARTEATPVRTTSGPAPLGDAVRADEVVLSSMTVTAYGHEQEDPGRYGGEDASEDASRSWYVRCDASDSPGETRLAGTLPVIPPNAAKHAVVPLGFALGTVNANADTDVVLACALFDLLPAVSRARVSRASLPLVRFADAGAEDAAVLSFAFPRGSRADDNASVLLVALELRRDARAARAAEGAAVRRDETNEETFPAAREDAEASKPSSSKPSKPSENETARADRWRAAFVAAAAIALAETCALLAVARERGGGASLGSRHLRVKRKTSDAPGGGRGGRRPDTFSWFGNVPQTGKKRGDASRAHRAPTRDDATTASPV